MTERTITKVLAAQEDLALGQGSTVQTRQGVNTTVTLMDLPWVYTTVGEIGLLDTTKLKHCMLSKDNYFTFYRFDAASAEIVDNYNFIAALGGGQWVRTAITGTEQTFVSVSEMQSNTNLVVGDRVKTLGYYSAGDGGANSYEIVAAATGTDDGGRYIDLVTHQAKGLFPDGKRNVRQWGAKGDNSATDTSYLQAAINATTATGAGLPAGALTLDWLDGTYLIDASLTVDGTFNWIGTSKTGTEIKALAGVTEMISLPDSVIGDTSITQRSSITGMRFIGNSIATHGIKGYTNNFTMRDCYINATLTSAIDISYGWSIVYDNVEISNNSGDGITARGQGSNNSVSITHCKIFSNSGVGVIAGSSTNSFTIDSGTTIELNAKGGVLLTNDLRNCTIRDSYFESNANTGYTFTTPAETIKADIIINGGGTTNLSYGAPCVNTVIDSNYVASGGGTAFIYATGMNGGRVSNNTLHNSTASLIATYGNVSGNLTYGQFSNVKIFGNSGFTKKYTGTHDGSNNSATLSDSSASFPVDYLIGSVVKNVTDDSYNLITDNTATTVTASLVGGTDNDWDTGDTYEIVIPELRIMNMPLAGTGAVLDSGSGFAGIEYDEAEKIELTEADFNKWTLVSGSGGTWQRSSTVFDLNPNALVWEIEYLSSGESGRFGFQIDMDDYPNLQGMFGEFVIYAKSPNDPYINTYVNGVSDTPSESITDWIPYRTIFRFPVKGVMDFSVTKVGASGTVQFACPVVRELGGITKELCDERSLKTNFLGTAAPTAGTWKRGDRVYNTTPSVDGNNMVLDHWVCTVAGSPGTWVAQYLSTVSPAT